MATPLPHHRFTVDEYERMRAVGILTGNDRVAFVAGEVLDIPPNSSLHHQVVAQLRASLRDQVRDAAFVAVEYPLRLGDNIIQPDIAVCKPGSYDADTLTPADVFVAIEVVDDSANEDYAVKMPLYEEAGIAEMWLIDLANERISRHTTVQPEGYREIRFAFPGELLTSTVLPDMTIAADTASEP